MGLGVGLGVGLGFGFGLGFGLGLGSSLMVVVSISARCEGRPAAFAACTAGSVLSTWIGLGFRVSVLEVGC